MLKSKTFYKFALVGALNTALDFIILNLAVYILNPSAGSSIIKIINLVSTLVVMSISFYLNQRFVFAHKNKTKRIRQIHRFAIVNFGSILLFQVVLFSILNNLAWPANLIKDVLSGLKIDFFTLRFYQLNFAKVISTIAVMAWNFMLYNNYVFEEIRSKKE
jgi:putative flippase GtrA